VPNGFSHAMNEVNELLPTRQSLLSRLRDWNDQEGWKLFFETYWKLIYNAAIKAGLTDAEAQDVVQETVISVSKSMPDFKYEPFAGSFKSWLLNLTGWRISDQLRKRQRGIASAHHTSDSTRRTATLERVPDPAGVELESIWDAEWEKNLMDAAIERVKRKVDPKQYQIFDLYALKKWPVTTIAETLKISVGRIYLTKHRVSRLIRKELEELESKLI
jgi:RNA polymerase sigma factor (sigma-70 family)